MAIEGRWRRSATLDNVLSPEIDLQGPARAPAVLFCVSTSRRTPQQRAAVLPAFAADFIPQIARPLARRSPRQRVRGACGGKAHMEANATGQDRPVEARQAARGSRARLGSDCQQPADYKPKALLGPRGTLPREGLATEAMVAWARAGGLIGWGRRPAPRAPPLRPRTVGERVLPRLALLRPSPPEAEAVRRAASRIASRCFRAGRLDHAGGHGCGGRHPRNVRQIRRLPPTRRAQDFRRATAALLRRERKSSDSARAGRIILVRMLIAVLAFWCWPWRAPVAALVLHYASALRLSRANAAQAVCAQWNPPAARANGGRSRRQPRGRRGSARTLRIVAGASRGALPSRAHRQLRGIRRLHPDVHRQFDRHGYRPATRCRQACANDVLGTHPVARSSRPCKVVARAQALGALAAYSRLQLQLRAYHPSLLHDRRRLAREEIPR